MGARMQQQSGSSEVHRVRPGHGEIERLAAIPLLAMLDTRLLEQGLQRCSLVRCRPGVRVVEEGEYDDRFFVLVEGLCEVSIAGSSEGRESITAWMRGGDSLRESVLPGRVLAIADLHAGDFFGEMACMSPWPRTSTVVTLTDSLLLEVEGEVFNDWSEGSDGFRQTMEEVYMSRGLRTLLRAVSAFAPLGNDAVDELASRASLQTCSKGDVVFREGDEATGFYLIRGGNVAVARRVDGVDKTVSYLRTGSYFGEAALLSGTPRTATVIAASQTELLCIPRESFLSIVARRPEAATHLERTARRRAEATQLVLANDDVAQALSFMVDEGILQSPDLLAVDLARCTRCGLCEAACKARHGVSLISLHGPTHAARLFPSACRHCSDPMCLLSCPVDAIHRDREGEVRFQEHCIGCGRCQVNCPYGTISLRPRSEAEAEQARLAAGLKRPVTHRAAKCDLCRGIGALPLCVRNCPTASLLLASPKELLRPLGVPEGVRPLGVPEGVRPLGVPEGVRPHTRRAS